MLRSECCAPVLLALMMTACAPAGEDQTGALPDTMGSAAGDTAGFTAADRSAIESASQRWITAAEAGNWDEVAALYTDDAVIAPPNAEAQEGRMAVREFMSSFPTVQSVEFEQVDMEGSGDLAFVYGRYTMTMQPPQGEAVEDRGKYIEVWQRQSDGQWRITHDIFNSDLPAQPGAMPPTTRQ